MENATNGKEEIEKLEQEIEKLTLLKNKIKEALTNPFLNIETRRKYRMAVPEYEGKIKKLHSSIRALEMLQNYDPDEEVKLPAHYQHHKFK
ncbi:MAG: hypothetical protein ACE14T_05590 [Syntrophales bacterium]